MLGLQSLGRDLSHAYSKIISDNTTAVAYINNIGGSHSPLCNDMARAVWEWCIDRDIWLTASHILGKLNVIADKRDAAVYVQLMLHFGTPKWTCCLTAELSNVAICLAASDPRAWAIDAFALDWSNTFFYAFPPFSVIPQVLQKLDGAQTQAILTASIWLTQPWYPTLTKLLIQQPILLPKHKSNMTRPPKPEKEHPLETKLRLMAYVSYPAIPLKQRHFTRSSNNNS